MLSKRTLIFCLLLILFNVIYAQTEIDTLSFDYNKLPADEKADLLLEVGIGFLTLNDYTQALKYFDYAGKIYKDMKDDGGIAKIYNNIGSIHNRLGNYEKSLDFHFKALRIFEKQKILESIAESVNFIGMVYQNLKKFPESLDFYNRALQINYEINDLDGASKSLNNMGNIMLSMANFEQALTYYQKSLTLKDEMENQYGKAVTLNNIGMVYQGLKQYDEAQEYYEISLELMTELDDIHGIASSNYHIGVLHFEQGNENRAMDFLDIGLRYSILGNELTIQQNCYNLLSRIYANRKNYEKAFQTYKLYTDMKDELFTEMNNRIITETKIKYETEKKEHEIELLTNAANLQNMIVKRQSIYLVIFVIGFVVFALLAFFAYSQYKSKANSAQIIEDQNALLKEAYDQVKKLSKTDPLTKLLTRQDIQDKMQYEATRFIRNKSPFVIALCDIDNLKSVNERFSKDCGDIVLRSISELIHSKLRHQDHVGRWTATKFILVLPDTEMKGAKIVAEKLRKEVKNFDLLYGRYTIKVTITFGLGFYDQERDVNACIGEADTALRFGKLNHKNCVIAFNEMR
jgi:diguanylate cyclase (GGDEF)-like protein